MSSENSQLRADLAHALEQLEDHLAQLDARLRAETDYPTWAWQQADAKIGRRQASLVIQALDFQDGQDAHHTRIAPALFGAAPETLAAARAVNHWKNRVRAALAPMAKREILVTDPDTGAERKEPLDKVALRWLKHPRFHKRQALRELVVIDHPVTKGTFFWARLRKILRIDKAEAIRRLRVRLDHTDTPELRLEWDRLQALSPHEPLAVVNAPHIHPKVNLVLQTVDGIKRVSKRGVLPVLYPDRPGVAGPDIRPLPDDPADTPTRLRRSDVQIEDTPFLPSLHIHRYRADCRYRNINHEDIS